MRARSARPPISIYDEALRIWKWGGTHHHGLWVDFTILPLAIIVVLIKIVPESAFVPHSDQHSCEYYISVRDPNGLYKSLGAIMAQSNVMTNEMFPLSCALAWTLHSLCMVYGTP